MIATNALMHMQKTGKIALAEGQDESESDSVTRNQVACYIKQQLEQVMTPDHKPEVTLLISLPDCLLMGEASFCTYSWSFFAYS